MDRRSVRVLTALGVLACAAPASAATITVENATQLGDKIDQANTMPDADTIVFAPSISTITLSAELPQITQPLTIDGGAARVMLDGGSLSGNPDGLNVSGARLVVRRLRITGFENGISAEGGADLLVEASEVTESKADGIEVSDTARGVISGNVISDNAMSGVHLWSTAEPTTVRGNSIHSNGVGIRREAPAPFTPGLEAADSHATGTTVEGTLDGAASSAYRVEFFANPACDTGGEGRTFLGATTATTDTMGHASINHTVATHVVDGQVVTATATDADGDTSEFSNCQTVDASALPTLSVSDASATEGAPVTFTISLSAPSTGEVSVLHGTGPVSPTAYGFAEVFGKTTFEPGVTSQTVDVATAANASDEVDRTFLFGITQPNGAVIADDIATGTIVDDDPPTAAVNTAAPTIGPAKPLAGTTLTCNPGTWTFTGGAEALAPYVTYTWFRTNPGGFGLFPWMAIEGASGPTYEAKHKLDNVGTQISCRVSYAWLDKGGPLPMDDQVRVLGSAASAPVTLQPTIVGAVKHRGNTVTMTVSCPGPAPCTGVVTLAGNISRNRPRAAGRTVFGRKRFRVQGGRKRAVKVVLGRRAKRILRQRRRVVVRATLRLTTPTGTATTVKKVTLRRRR